MPQLRGTFVGSVDRLRYIGSLSLQLVASAAWDLCRLIWSLSLRGTFVAPVSCLRYGTFIASVGREAFVASAGCRRFT